MDGTSNDRGAKIGIVLTTPEGFIIEQSYTLGFRATNNEAEYEAVIAGLKMEATIKIAKLEVRCDSLYIASQIKEEYTTKDDQMATYLNIVTASKFKFSRCNFIQVPRSENSRADSLAILTSIVDFQFRREIPHRVHPEAKYP